MVGIQQDEALLLSLGYLIYLVLFFGAWLTGMMFLISDVLANGAAPLLASVGLSLPSLVPPLGTLLFLAWSTYAIYKATLRSPLIFSKEDAVLLCQTPADRRFVSFIWLVEAWMRQLLILGLLASTVGFSLYEMAAEEGAVLIRAALLAAAALKPLIILIPLHLGLLALAWMVGVYRLRKGGKHASAMRGVRTMVLAFAVLLSSATFIRLFFPGVSVPLSPLASAFFLPIRTAYFGRNRLLGLIAELGLTASSLAVLWWFSEALNLSRAAQETHDLHARRTAILFGHYELAQQMRRRKRLGPAHPQNRLPIYPGAWSLSWKHLVQSQRKSLLAPALSWASIFLLTLAVIAAGAFIEDIVYLLPLVFYWVVAIGQKTSIRLKKDLSRWWLLQSLPITGHRLLLHELLPPVTLTTLLTWAACWMTGRLGVPLPPLLVFSTPVVIAGIALANAIDVLGQKDPTLLLEGRTPDTGMVGLLLSFASLTVPAAIYVLSNALSLLSLFSVSIVLLLGGGMLAVMFRFAGRQFKQLG